MGVLRYLAPNMSTLKGPTKLETKILHPSDRIDLNLYFDMKKNNCQIIIDGNRAVGKL